MSDKLFVNYNFVKGAQKFLKEAGLVKYANEQAEDLDANVLANAMSAEKMDIPAEGAVPEQAVIEVANALMDMAQAQPEPAKTQLEGAAAQAAAAVAPGGAGVEEVKQASEIAAKIKKAAEGDATNNNPAQVLSVSNKDYSVSQGKSSLDTSKGEIGKQENKESEIALPKAPEAKVSQNEEGKDIMNKDYQHGKGKTTLDTSKGQIGAEETKKLAALALQTNLAKILGK